MDRDRCDRCGNEQKINTLGQVSSEHGLWFLCEDCQGRLLDWYELVEGE